MAMDGVTIAHLVSELAPRLAGARIDKVYQPEKEEIHLLLRNSGRQFRLLLNVNATAARFNISDENKQNPQTPPMFCMILRKHIEGGKIIALQQKGLERVVTLVIQNLNEAGDQVRLGLYLEIMGKHSNLILVDPGKNCILDGLKRYSHNLSRYREVLPGRDYLAPPAQGKSDPLSDEVFWRKQLYTGPLENRIAEIIVSKFAGISPELAQELILQAGLEDNTRLQECGEIDLARLFQSYSRLAVPAGTAQIQPCLYYEMKPNFQKPNISPLAFTFVPFQQYLGLTAVPVPTLNEAVQRFYSLKTNNNTLEAKRGSLKKIIQDYGKHLSKKLCLYEEAIASSQKSFNYQKLGELITANLYRIPAGAQEVTVEDYHQPDFAALTIPLKPNLSAIENAQRYYRLYNKAKTTIQKTEPLKTSTLLELRYLDSLIVSIDQAVNLVELDDIHSELAEQKYVTGKQINKKGQRPKKAAKKESPKPRTFLSSNGRIIFVAKNNFQNDWLTLRKGKPSDLWLHVKNIPGSHVLVPLQEGEEFPDDTTLEEAAALAIYFSQARSSALVPVDYTHIKHIKKPSGAKPGMIIYEKNWTLFLTPDQNVLERLLSSGETAETQVRPSSFSVSD
ncbi:MAG TPA: NFACT RNA binding domain-containing protein [Desulfitobacteriaceae bacterium]|nr:NFACT RNA binding domain-containing protein [Desulfitobacteriaceae bacterium]